MRRIYRFLGVLFVIMSMSIIYYFTFRFFKERFYVDRKELREIANLNISSKKILVEVGEQEGLDAFIDNICINFYVTQYHRGKSRVGCFYDMRYLGKKKDSLDVNRISSLQEFLELLFNFNLEYLRKVKNEGRLCCYNFGESKNFCNECFKIFYADSKQMFLIPEGTILYKKAEDNDVVAVLPLYNFKILSDGEMKIFYDWDLSKVNGDELKDKVLFVNGFVAKFGEYDYSGDGDDLLDLYLAKYREPSVCERQMYILYENADLKIYRTNDVQIYFCRKKKQ